MTHTENMENTIKKQEKRKADRTNRERFLDMNVYEIYPRSFKDTNGDGIGDLNGVTEKLDYLQELGVNAIWLCPCYKSPNYDNGYDIADYRAIAEEFGTFSDWERLRDGLHARGMKLIMDLVVNHTSSEHFWFREAKKSRDNPYHDYYIWAEKPPNKWKSVFGGSAWEYNEQTKEYYLHSFAVQQPDLNWKNPAVRKECRDIVDFWIDHGVDGFRCDVLDYISKDFKTDKMYGGPQLHKYLRELFSRRKTAKLFLIGECQSNEKDIIDICGKDRGELTTVFQFDHMTFKRMNKYLPPAFSFPKLKRTLVKWQNFAQKHDLLYTLFTDNHDYPFYLSRFGNDKELRYECATMLATTFFLLRGIPFLYQGQEFGAVNSFYDTIAAFNDVESQNYYHARKGKIPEKELFEQVNRGSRDNSRRPMAWTENAGTMYGFTNGKPWLSPPSRTREINAEADKKSQKSVFLFYQKLLAFRRKNIAVRRGDFQDLTGKRKNCFLYSRAYQNQRVIVVINFEKAQTIPTPRGVNEKTFTFAFGNYADSSPFSKDFRPFEIAVYRENA